MAGLINLNVKGKINENKINKNENPSLYYITYLKKKEQKL